MAKIEFSADGSQPLTLGVGLVAFELQAQLDGGATLTILSETSRVRHVFSPSADPEENEIMLAMTDKSSTAVLDGQTSFPFVLTETSFK